MSSRIARCLRIGFAGAALTVVATVASAGPIFAVELDFGTIDLSAPTPLSESTSFHSGFEGTNFYSFDAFASAGPGSLSASSLAMIQLTPAVTLGLGTVLNGTDALAAFVLDDIVIGGIGTTVPGSLNLQLDGGLAADTFAQLGTGVGSEAKADASVSVFVGLNGSFFSGTQAIASFWNVDTQSGGGSSFEDGLLTGFTGSGGLITPTVMLPVGIPFNVSLSLYTSANTESLHTILGSRRQAEASSLFDTTLSFPLFGPVFNLPAGYTVQSVSGNIVNNQWQGLAPPPPPPVPEPSSFLLMGTAVLYMARRASKRGRERKFLS